VNEPEVNLRDNRMTPKTFEGVTLVGKIGDVSYTAAYLDEMKDRNSDRFRILRRSRRPPQGVSEPLWLRSLSYSATVGAGLRSAPAAAIQTRLCLFNLAVA
jgi:hypothetical protein